MARARANDPGPRYRSMGLLATLIGAAVLASCQQTVAFELLEGGTTNDAGTETGVCSGGSIAATPESAAVLVAFDRGTSTSGSFGPQDRDSARQVLIGLAYKYEPNVRVGYVGFPGVAPASPSCFSNIECCSSIVTIPPGKPGAFEYAIDGCQDCVQGDDRPTAAALASCATYFASPGAGRNRHVLLITDGPPGCTSGDACRETQITIMGLVNEQVDVRVLGLGPPSPDLESCFLGTGGNGQYHGVARMDVFSTLDRTFREMAADACTLDLDPKAKPEVTRLRVLVAGNEVPHGGSNGWELDGTAQHIVLSGTACDALITPPLNGPPNSAAVLDCGSRH